MKKNFYKRVQAKLFRLMANNHVLSAEMLPDAETICISTGYELFLIPAEKLLLNPTAMKQGVFADAETEENELTLMK